MIIFFRAENDKFKCKEYRKEPPFLPEWSRPNLTGVGSGTSGLPDPEPPKKLAAPQHYWLDLINLQDWEGEGGVFDL